MLVTKERAHRQEDTHSLNPWKKEGMHAGMAHAAPQTFKQGQGLWPRHSSAISALLDLQRAKTVKTD